MRLPLVLLTVICCVLSPAVVAEEIALTTGEVLRATIIEMSADGLVVDHPLLGRLTIPLAGVASIDGRPLEPEQFAAAQTENAEAETNGEAAERRQAEAETALDSPGTTLARSPDKKKPLWDSQLEVGLASTDGSTQDTSLRLGLRTSRKTERSLLRGDASYRMASSRGDRTENRFTTGVFGEWNRPGSRWSAFAQGRLDADEFQAWDRRLTLGGGTGYRLFDVKGRDEAGSEFDLLTLTARLGGGLRREYGSLNEDIAPEGLLGAELAYRISSHQQLAANTTLYPDLGDTGDFRLVSSLDWSIDINHMDGVSLKVGLVHEYESRTNTGVPHNDVAAQALLVVDF